MIDVRAKLNEQFEQFARLQREALENMQTKGLAAVDYFEKVARYQLDAITDFANLSAEQARVAANAETPCDYLNQQIDGAAALARTVEARMNEFIDLLSSATAAAGPEIGDGTEKAAA